jgi:hypothetical protein
LLGSGIVRANGGYAQRWPGMLPLWPLQHSCVGFSPCASSLARFEYSRFCTGTTYLMKPHTSRQPPFNALHIICSSTLLFKSMGNKITKKELKRNSKGKGKENENKFHRTLTDCKHVVSVKQGLKKKTKMK